MISAGATTRNGIRFERRVPVSDGDDGLGNVITNDWTSLYAGHAQFRPEFGREQLQAGRLESTLKGVLTVRRNAGTSGVTTADRVVFLTGPYAGRSGQLRAITPTPDNREIEILIECGVAE